MTPLLFTLVVFTVSVAAGLLGSLLGLGGGIIVVPALTLLLHVDIRFAIGASIVSVIATSSGAAAAYVRDGMTNLRVAMFRKRHAEVAVAVVPADGLADRLALHGSYVDEALGREVEYPVTGSTIGLALMYVAGVVSGLLGIGSGALKVPAMDLAMRLPIKVSTATSNFMIGVTAAASAGVYFARGQVDPFVAGPVAMGVLTGALTGSRLLGRLHSAVIRKVFVAVLLWVSLEMLLKGL